MRRLINSRGYALVFVPGHPTAQATGWAREHRYVWWENYGAIPEGHIIHHKNRDKTDNRPKNLECLTMSAHTKTHLPETKPFLDKHRHIGTQALVEMNTGGPAWNAGTAEYWDLICSICGVEFKRLARWSRKTQTQGYNHVCSRKCQGQAMKRAREAKARGES